MQEVGRSSASAKRHLDTHQHSFYEWTVIIDVERHKQGSEVPAIRTIVRSALWFENLWVRDESSRLSSCFLRTTEPLESPSLRD